MPPTNTHNASLEATASDLKLGYGDAALVANRIMRCLEYELPRRDARITDLEARLAQLEAALEQHLVG